MRYPLLHKEEKILGKNTSVDKVHTIFCLTFIKQADGNDKISGRGFKILRQRLKFDNYLVNICETTIKQILFIATIWQILQSKWLKFLHLSFICN